LFENEELELVSQPGEPLERFRQRCRREAELKRNQALELEDLKFKPKIDAAKASTSKGREDRVARLEADLEAKKSELTEKWRRIGEDALPIQVKPRKIDIRVTHFGLAWTPFWIKA